jgi:hypothetical protein
MLIVNVQISNNFYKYLAHIITTHNFKIENSNYIGFHFQKSIYLLKMKKLRYLREKNFKERNRRIVEQSL